jgi:hypothetical protein
MARLPGSTYRIVPARSMTKVTRLARFHVSSQTPYCRASVPSASLSSRNGSFSSRVQARLRAGGSVETPTISALTAAYFAWSSRNRVNSRSQPPVNALT